MFAYLPVIGNPNTIKEPSVFHGFLSPHYDQLLLQKERYSQNYDAVDTPLPSQLQVFKFLASDGRFCLPVGAYLPLLNKNRKHFEGRELTNCTSLLKNDSVHGLYARTGYRGDTLDVPAALQSKLEKRTRKRRRVEGGGNIWFG